MTKADDIQDQLKLKWKPKMPATKTNCTATNPPNYHRFRQKKNEVKTMPIHTSNT